MNLRLLFCSLLWLAFSPALSAQDADGDKKEKPSEKSKGDAENVIREQTIYIPYTKLRETFEKEGRGVFLPYERFQQLWQAAREKETPATVVKGPTGAIITEIDNTAVVEKDVVKVSAKVSIELLSKGWHHVPIRLGDAAIISAKIDDDAARLLPGGQGYQLLVQHTDEKAKRIVLTLEYAKAFAKNPGQNSVAFEAPQAPVNRWQIRVPQSAAKINVHPMIAASEVPTADKDANGKDEKNKTDDKDKKKSEETVMLAFVGTAPTVRIDWTAKSEGASGLAALVNVQAQQEVTLDEGVLRTRATLAYDISRAELSQLVVEVPADQKVVNVFDPNVRQWDVKAEGGTQQVIISLFQPTKGAQQLVVELEKFLADMNQKELSLPTVKAVGVGRQQGVAVVRVASSLRAEVTKRTGLTQLDAAELPAALARSKWDFAYRYATLPFELVLTTEKLQPKIRVEELVEAFLEPEQLTLSLFAKYVIERAGVFQLELDIPSGFEVRTVRGQAASGAQPVAVDSHHVQGENKTRLVVNLAQKALGTAGLYVELQKRLEDPNLLSPTGKNSELNLVIPRALVSGIEHNSGRLVLFTPESLRVNPTKQNGVRVISLADAYQSLQSTREGRFSNVRELLAFAFTPQAIELTVSAERRKPYVTVKQLLVSRVDSGVVKYEATFFYDIRYSGVKTVRIDLPEELAQQIRNETPAIRERTLDPAPEDVPPKHVAWSFAGETELFGQPRIRLTWEKKLDELQVGKPLELALPRLVPRGVDRASGQLVITKAESIDIQPAGEATGLRPIDPQHDLMPEASVPDAARAFEFQDDWSLKIVATRYKLEEVKRTSVERSVIRFVVTRSREISVQAVYRVRSAHQRLAIQLPAGFKLDTQPLTVDGKRVALERGDKDELFVPLVAQSAERPFVLELRYTLAGDHRRLDLPEFLDDPAVHQVHLCVYLPKERVLLGATGPWTEEFSWYRNSLFSSYMYPHRNDVQLLQELVQGTNVTDNLAQTFPTDGTQYVYSTLSPTAAPEGSLRLVAWDKNWFHFAIFAVIVATGLALLRQPCSQRFIAVAGLIVLLVLCGVFLPTLSQQVFCGTLYAAMGVVAVVWLVNFLTRLDWNKFRRPKPVDTDAAVTSPFATVPTSVDSPQFETPPADTGGTPPASAPNKPSDENNNKNEGEANNV